MFDFKETNHLVTKPSISKQVEATEKAEPDKPQPQVPPPPAAYFDTPALPAIISTVFTPKDEFEYDIFISYAHANGEAVDAFVEFLNKAKPGLRIFHDKESIGAGTQWFMHIYQSLDKSKRVVALMNTSALKQGNINLRDRFYYQFISTIMKIY